ncbi:2Fe-2S iron-sulfur cluster-binding protein [Rhizorhabdus dicambivorans]|uniref:2Fe-2S ferredoxin n=1 Tax=Rhizorhabdus dicambivorans TaxID=1850238 RepID=A0A2A4FYA1_9SPHN|nr:2Fe-2S iron-sulfur cluster-binding protein [Rhizorhabdus dicambivorans]ATE67190.1 2Fe-2S ferredoxin [Rhizorhabdus dicambivorans]PCE42682.1 2Fe-2S ferredoxin [Rhizorhabdus dicambivorans]
MPRIIFRSANGEARAVDGSVGDSVMETALAHNIAGIDAYCGGACACATCHVYIDEEWMDLTDRPGDMEDAMLDFVDGRTGASRLSCQIVLTAALDGLSVTTPAHQKLV